MRRSEMQGAAGNITLPKVELLAPGGSPESIRAAVNAGADAVYAGGSMFGARAFAENPDQASMLEAIDYCHLHGAKLYLTVNTLLKEEELERRLYEYILPVYERGVDAVLVQDFGVFHFLREHFPKLPLHASTQMTVTGAYGAVLLQKMGAERVVLSRELSLSEISMIRDKTDVELETFVHGALCYCYSGQCLMSSMIGGRSGNRGRCAQPCRLAYALADERGKRICDGQYLLSLRDMAAISILPQLIGAGISSLKIEGRMKSPEYASGVTSIYRRYIDRYYKAAERIPAEKICDSWSVSREDMRDLTDLFCRGSFTAGYYQCRNGEDMIVREDLKMHPPKSADLTRAQKLTAHFHELYAEKEPQIKVHGIFHMREGEKIRFEILSPCRVCAQGDVPQRAKSRPLDEAAVRKQAEKTGGTPFVFGDLQIDMEDGLFCSLKELNDVRRIALGKLKDEILAPYRRDPQSAEYVFQHGGFLSVSGHPYFTVSVETSEQLEAVLKEGSAGGVYVDYMTASEGICRKIHEHGKKAYLSLLPVWRADTVRSFERKMPVQSLREYDGLLLKSFDQLEYVRTLREKGILNSSCELIADAGLYTWNRQARYMLSSLGITADTAPFECTAGELKDRGMEYTEMVIYGYQPLMVTANCLVKNSGGCRHQPSVRYLVDRRGISFPVRNECGICMNTIFNSVPLELISLGKEIRELKASSVRLNFTVEDGRKTSDILRAAVLMMNGAAKEEYSALLPQNFTRGHFRKGVE